MLKYFQVSMSPKRSRSSSGVCAVSRSTSRPVSFSTAGWPPLRSAGVFSHTSITNGSPSAANQVSTRGSSTAPRLSEFEMNAYS